jgi:sigma-B regulation protein RsbU (phosphoserine phosphatase)
MEQLQFRVSLSVGTKLLLGVVSLLFIVIAFLDVSTILLLTDDKRAYTFQAQANEALLAGKEFINDSKHAFDTLRIGLGSLDPLKPISQEQTARMQTLADNQSELAALTIGLLNPADGVLSPVVQVSRPDRVSALGLAPEDWQLSAEALLGASPELLKEGWALVGASRLGRPPLVALVIADLKQAQNPTGVPVAVGFRSIADLGLGLKASTLTLATRDGRMIYDSDPAVFFGSTDLTKDPLFQAATAGQITQGAQEYEFEGARYLGSYYRPGLNVVVLTKTGWRKAMRATYALTERFILLGLMAIGSAILFAILFSKTITAPLNRLYKATRQVAEGNFELDLNVKNRDEIGALGHSFGVMSRKIVDLIQESVRKAHLESELAIASTVQQTLIPPNEFRNQNVLIRSHYQSANECGGDWWGFFGVGPRLCVMIADATGHGLPSALITASARSCFSVMHKLAQEDPEFTFSPGAMLSYANRVVHDAASGKIMMTFFTGVIDLQARQLTYASAGHNPPWLFTKEGDKFALKSLTAVGQRLGEARDVAPYVEKTVPLTAEDVLFLYTDGLMEGKNLAGDQYGKKKVRKLVEGALPRGPEALIRDLMADFLNHNEGKTLDDDVTLAAVKFLSFPDAGAGPGGAS